MRNPIVIQNADRDVTASFFKDMPENTLLVSSHFYTLQGEGQYAGHPAFFIRLAGCNFGSKKIACLACDTNFQIDKASEMTIDDLVAAASEHSEKAQLVVITGGEPTLQRNVVALAEALLDIGYTVQIETNGSQLSVMQELTDGGSFVVCSPKASAKGYGNVFTQNHMDAVSAYKFVLDPSDPAHAEVPKQILDAAMAGAAPPIYVSPCTIYKKAYQGEVSSAWDETLVDKERTRANYVYCGQYAMKHGLRVSIQMHTWLDLA